jgi:hypothetical protein
MQEKYGYFELDFKSFISSLFSEEAITTIMQDGDTSNAWRVKAFGNGTIEYKKELQPGLTLYAWHHSKNFDFSDSNAPIGNGVISAHIFVDANHFPEIKNFQIYEEEGLPNIYDIMMVNGWVRNENILINQAYFFGENVTSAKDFFKVYEKMTSASQANFIDINKESNTLEIKRLFRHTMFPEPSQN